MQVQVQRQELWLQSLQQRLAELELSLLKLMVLVVELQLRLMEPV